MRVRSLLLAWLLLGAVFPVLALAASPAATKTLKATLLGKNEVPKGSPTASGKALVRLDTSKGTVCWTFSDLKGLDKVTAAHIHQAPAGKAGNVIVPFFADALKKTGCVKAAKTLIAAIEKSPSGYYVNIHTVKYPAGAIRGQL
jgi:hypothetical protein